MSAQKPTVTLREATLADVPAMVDAYFDGFFGSPLTVRCFPPDEPEVRAYWTKRVEGNIGLPGNHIVVAVSPDDPASSSGPGPGPGPGILGWVRWVRCPEGPPPKHPLALTPAMYPSSGDGAAAARFFQAAGDAAVRYVAGREYWLLSTILTRRDAQRRGVGAALMNFGVERIDKDGWMAYTNASKAGRPLYERFGFKVVGQSWFDELGLDMFHMVRDPKAVIGA
ncbi:hypothetical protein QQZ08_002032 [Neonectria magnoliae]|uniref:N-acetyltransferase domain-containing protein n=1 Tax=Neonectria magnoliae TaxID=2732573 RepID=A0ABR1IEI5_9HYPO